MEMTIQPFSARSYMEEAKRILDLLERQAGSFIATLYEAFQKDRTVFVVGNGGSASNASHFAQDLNKGTLSSTAAVKRFRAIALTDNISWITAIANDCGYESVFVDQLKTLARPGDVLVAISGSGNSPNVLRAVEYANAHDIRTVAVTGYDGGKLRPMASVAVHVPSFDMGLVEGMHSVLFHLTMGALRGQINGQGN